MKKVLLLLLLLFFSAPLNGYCQSSCESRLDRGWRGLDCFHCMHPKAEGGSAPIADILVRSCLKRVMLAFVVDGSFGYNESEVKSSIDAITSSGQELWLHLYVYNGPAQRRWQSGVFQSFAIMDPNLFQHKIVGNRSLRAKYAAVVKERISPLVAYALQHGAKVSVAPGLEDNLNDQGFNSALGLLKKNIPRGLNVAYARNACFRCTLGNGKNTPKGILLEEHDDTLFARRWDGIINTDGRYFRFSFENSSLPALFDLAPRWLTPANNQRNAFLLWIPHLQDTPPTLIPKPLGQRNFRAPTENEAAEIIDFLRY